MDQAAGKRWPDDVRLETSKAFVLELARSVQIPTDLLSQTIATGPNEQRGTWVHPQVAIHLAMWCSAAFAVRVTRWVEAWLSSRRDPRVADELSSYHGVLALIRADRAIPGEKPRFSAVMSRQPV
jgi:hypothetical protein